MRHSLSKRILASVLSLWMALSVGMPSVALAQASNVQVENHTQLEGRVALSNVRIDGVDAPQAGMALDDTASVTADPNASWDIPVLWVADDLSLATQAEEGKTYVPVLAFFVPQGYALEGDAFTVALSDSLTRLFGGNDIISVFDASTGISYIMPASIRGLFGAARANNAQAPNGTADQAQATPAPAPAPAPAQQNDGQQDDQERSLIDIYCAKTAKDAISNEDLEWLLDLIINTLEPQAVELLLNSFPSFRVAAQNGEIGTQIGMYVYYKHGDKDGIIGHGDTPADALAYVSARAIADGDVYKYCYLLGVDVDDLIMKNDDDEPIPDAATGMLRIARDSTNMRNFENTIVHELFHALMDDYNRTGMAGVTNIADYVLDNNGDFPTKALSDRFDTIHFPTWFIEGSASAVENVYQFRKNLFDGLRTGADGKVQNAYTQETFLDCYLAGKVNGEYAFYDLGFCRGIDGDGNAISNTPSAYICGYLATLYLADLAATKNTGSSAIVIQNDKIVDVSTEKLRLGLDSMLERMHKGETLDQVIADISPNDGNGSKLYKDAADFEDKFIKGPEIGKNADGNPLYDEKGDEASLSFVVDYLNYLTYVGGQEGRANEPNGSILFPIDEDFRTPLDNTKPTSSDYLKIIESNTAVESTVPNSVALAGGGKTDPDAALSTTASGDKPQPLDDATTQGTKSDQGEQCGQDNQNGQGAGQGNQGSQGDQSGQGGQNSQNAEENTSASAQEADTPVEELAPAAKATSQDGEVTANQSDVGSKTQE